MYQPFTVKVTRSAARNGSAMADIEVFDYTTELPPMVDACCEPGQMAAASRLAQKLSQDRARIWSIAVYVIGPRDDIGIHKIGISNNPIDRLSGLQIGNWHPLMIRSLTWVHGLGFANKVEKLAHKAAAEMGVDIGGEWVGLDARESTELVIKAARYARVPICDSGAQLRNLAARTVAISKIIPGLQKAA